MKNFLKRLKRYIPERQELLENKYLRIFGGILHDPNLWHLNRYSVATAFSIGIFSMLIPIPFQMLLAAALAILFHANLPISVVLVWISNPVTMPAIFYFCYKIGAWILDTHPEPIHIQLSWEWLGAKLHMIWKPLLLGSFICAFTGAVLVNLLIRGLWRLAVLRNWKIRKNNRSTASN